MPTYKNITLSLRSSAHETAPLLEFPPPPHLPIRVEDVASATAAVYVLASPGLTFWIAYHVKPPVPPDTRFFVFKLFMDGHHVVTWAVGEDGEWKGKTMFGLFENQEWRGGVEKRAFAFACEREGRDVDAATDHESRVLEVRVFRAGARKRIQREAPELMETEVGKEGAGGIELVNAGCLKKENPKRFYRFALIDSLKEPYATFRYYYRSLEQLKTLGVVIEGGDGEDEALTDSGNGFQDLDLSFLSKGNAGSPSTVVEQPATLGRESPPLVAQESLNLAVSTNNGDPEADTPSTPTSGTEAADLMRHVGLSADIEPPHTSSPSMPATKRNSSKPSPWSPPRSATMAMRNSAVIPMTVPDSPTKGSVADMAVVGALTGQDWLKRTPSPDRSMYREFDSPAPGASRHGRKSPTGKLKDILRRALRRGES